MICFVIPPCNGQVVCLVLKIRWRPLHQFPDYFRAASTREDPVEDGVGAHVYEFHVELGIQPGMCGFGEIDEIYYEWIKFLWCCIAQDCSQSFIDARLICFLAPLSGKPVKWFPNYARNQIEKNVVIVMIIVFTVRHCCGRTDRFTFLPCFGKSFGITLLPLLHWQN